MTQTFSVKALRILKVNIAELLIRRGYDQVSLAQYVGHTKAWINKFLNDEAAEIQLRDLDRIADFLHVVPYQLFQPGLSPRVERRHSPDRRSGQERRIGQQGRHLASLRTELNKLPSLRSAHGVPPASRASELPDEVLQIIANADKDIAAFYARQQAPAARLPRAPSSKGHRGDR